MGYNNKKTAKDMKWGLPRTRTLLIFLLLPLILGVLFFVELNSSSLQSWYLSKLSAKLIYTVEPGASRSIRFPEYGPYDIRLGFTRIPQMSRELKKASFEITSQAVITPKLAEVIDGGLFPIYHEKSSSGLEITDLAGREIHRTSFPESVYFSFEAIPELLVKTLLFIENRELLSTTHPHKNPAVEWDRLFKAVFEMGWKIVDPDHNVPGGSTLATQLEKFRHSPNGRTEGPKDKLQQMISASVRAYLDGRDTSAARKEIVLSYINSIPLSAAPQYGEVNGLGDGLRVWYGSSLSDLQKALTNVEGFGGKETATLYKQALSLFVAQRRPSYYLLADATDLNELVDQYLTLLERDGVIPQALADASRAVTVEPKPHKTQRTLSFIERKAPDLIRTQLLSLLRARKLYELDRYDLTVRSTLNLPLQQEITSYLTSLDDPDFLKAQNLTGPNLIASPNDADQILLSLSLVESTPFGNLLRVQTDNFDQPLNIQQGAQLDLGSTAKLRTLISYLQVVQLLHEELSPLDERNLKALDIHPADNISEWAQLYLLGNKGASLEKMLDASLERQYSANPAEQFFTGGGLHSFENFNREDNGKVVSIKQALRHSINLPFIRLMRDVVNYYIYHGPEGAGRILEDKKDTRRREYLSQFAEKEGATFVLRFFRKYRNLEREAVLDELLKKVRPTPERLAQVIRALDPEVPFTEFKEVITERLKHLTLKDETLKKLYERNPEAYRSLLDRGYIARIHPLELWVASYVLRNENAPLRTVIEASYDARQEVYTWLFESRHKKAQNTRIRIMLETEAFTRIHKDWKKLGYPFSYLVPSYATAIGSSADRPAALTELMGIIANDGLKRPTVMIDRLHFAATTPFETVFDYNEQRGEEVLHPSIAQTVRTALIDVVANGTARRVSGAFVDEKGEPIPIGGKTGTGDHRYEKYGADGRLISSRAVNRSATFTFFIGDRFFGTLVVFVRGEAAEKFKFTSALPVQILKNLAPAIQTHTQTGEGG